jgi:predicted kinase
MYHYSCYGLGIESEIVLPLPLPPRQSTAALPIVEVLVGGFDAPASLELPCDLGGAAFGPYSGGIVIRMPGLPDFFASESCIRIGDLTTEEEVGDIVVRMILLFVFQLRSMLTFHGSAASRNGRAVALFGYRGAGKSTTAMGLAKRGWSFLSDDIVAVDTEGVVPQGATRARLNSDSFVRLIGGAFSGALRDRDGKYAVEHGVGGDAATLGQVVVLKAAEVGAVEAREIRGYAKLRLALAHLHSLPSIGDPRSRLHEVADTLARIPLFVVQRPIDSFALDGVLDTIEALSLREVE